LNAEKRRPPSAAPREMTTAAVEPSLAFAALDYARRGWPVFPCRPGRKLPDTLHGCKDATTDLDRVAGWWWHSPDANIGIATGAPGPDVLDVDTKNGAPGYATLNRLKRAGLVAGAHRMVRTPSGGLHLYYAGSSWGNGALPKHGVDFRAAGGYVLAPPSNVDGTPYELLEERPESGAILDQDAIRVFLAPPREVVPIPPGTGGLAALIAWVAKQPEGNRNRGLYWAACRAVQGGLDPTPLTEAAVAAGLTEVEASRTVASAARRYGGAA
jgi:Bifunctional DNA primase/polymerase, N-terminal